MAKTVRLNTGNLMPIIGLGTFRIRGPDVTTTLAAALTAGYRSIDTATVYRNEVEICHALENLKVKHNLTRQDLFITSKLGPKDLGAKCREACLQSLQNLGTEYLDLYLIHWPGGQGLKPGDPLHPALRRESWQQMEQLYREGRVRAIGVSNYSIRQMEELLSYCTVTPAVLQTEHQPHLQQRHLVELCRTNGIHFQAYSSLGTAAPEHKLLNDAVVQKVASEWSRSPAQVLLRWAVQQDIGVLPKSTNPVHIAENMAIFDFNLSDHQMAELSAQHRDLHYAWDPSSVT